MMSRSPRKNLTFQPWLSALALTLITSIALGDDTLTKELESKMATLLDEHEFGLTSYASEAYLEIESSPDSIHWFEGGAKFAYLLNDQVEFRHADWNLTPIDGSTTRSPIDKASGLPYVPRLFDFTTCSRSLLKYGGIFYDLDRLNHEGAKNEWQITGDRRRQASCVAIEPMNWPFINTGALSRGSDLEKSFPNRFQLYRCAKAVQTDSRIAQTVWIPRVAHPGGYHIVFTNITFKDSLPTVAETFFAQTGFRDINDLPDRKKCRLNSLVETTWTTIDDVPVPEKIVARLQNSGFKEVNELILNVKLKYWSPGSKEYETIKSVADKAVIEIEKLKASKK